MDAKERLCVQRLNYSRQREAIINNLSRRHDHPTAEMIYEEVRREYPQISLGTVYRNLNVLTETGQVARLDTGDGIDHFDALTIPHYHYVCRKCGMISDIDMPVSRSLNERVQKYVKGTVESSTAIFYGTCEECRKADKETG